MSIYTSNRPNDRDMIRALGSLAVPIPLLVDCAFSGIGDHDQVLAIAVERKKLGDLVSCILNGRYLHQAQQAKEAGFDILCLIWEAERIRPNPNDGLLEIPVWGINPRTLKRSHVWQPVQPTITYSRFDQYLTELDYLAGIIVKRSHNVRETAAIIKALWDNFQTPPGKHQSLNQVFSPAPNHVQLVRPNLVRRIAKEIDGIGWEWSRVVADRFRSPRDMVCADVETWASLEIVSEGGKKRRLGNKVAAKVVRALNGGKL